MTKTLRSAGAAACAFLLTAGIVGTMAEQPAAAQSFTVTAPTLADTVTERVPTAGLNLAQDRDVRRLDARIRAASRRVCAPLSVGKSLAPELRCRHGAVQSAAPQVALLVQRAQALAAAGLPTRIASTVAVSARSE